MAHRPFTADEEIEINRLLTQGASKRLIGRVLNRRHSSIVKFLARRNVESLGAAIDAAAKATIKRASVTALDLRPSSISARPFSAAWWRQNDRSFVAGFKAQKIGVSTQNQSPPKKGRG